MGNSNFISLPQLITKTINKMGKMKEQFMQDREETINTMHEIAEGYNKSTNQLNNKMSKKNNAGKTNKTTRGSC